MIDSNSLTQLKPHPEPFLRASRMIPDGAVGPVVFFDDVANNLLIPKKMGWTTYLVGYPREIANQLNWVDYSFPNIYQALQHLIKKNN